MFDSRLRVWAWTGFLELVEFVFEVCIVGVYGALSFRFRGLGFRVLGFRVLGFGVLGLGV